MSYIGYKYQETRFNEIKIARPVITQEEAHIDIWIRDTNYAIIIENKVYKAVDQDEQIARYIETTLNGKKYKQDQIFIIYLPQSPSDPVEHSWGKYKADFEGRYCSLSFQEDILPWMKKQFLPLLYLEDEQILKSSLIQYIDYLEGLFNQRNSLRQFYMDLQNIISEKLGLYTLDTTMEKYVCLSSKISELNEVLNKMQEMRDTMRLRYWKEDFNEREPGYAPAEGCLFGCVLIHNDENYLLHIEDARSRCYCQLDKTKKTDGWSLEKDIIMGKKELGSVLIDKNNIQIWRYYDREDAIGVYDCFLSAIEMLKDLGCIVVKQ